MLKGLQFPTLLVCVAPARFAFVFGSFLSGTPRASVQGQAGPQLIAATCLISSAVAHSLVTHQYSSSLPAASRCQIFGVSQPSTILPPSFSSQRAPVLFALQVCSQQHANVLCLSSLGQLPFQHVFKINSCPQQLPYRGLCKLVPNSLPWTLPILLIEWFLAPFITWWIA